MMVGLPDSSEKDDIQTAKDIIKLKPKNGKNLSSFSNQRNRVRRMNTIKKILYH